MGFSWLTAHQDPQCASIIAATTACYAIGYFVLRSTNALQPAKGTLRSADEAEWRSRILGTVNAVALTVGSVACFLEWPYDPPTEGWNGDIWSHPGTFASLFVGYLQWDLLWLLWHSRDHYDPSSIVHHTLFLAITHYVLSGTYFKRPFAWLSFTELSTPFLNARWCLAAAGQKTGKAYFLASLGFAVTFLATRVVGYTIGLIDMWLSADMWRSRKSGLVGLDLVAFGLHAAFCLNLFWSIKVVSAVKRSLGRRPAVEVQKKKCQ